MQRCARAGAGRMADPPIGVGKQDGRLRFEHPPDMTDGGAQHLCHVVGARELPAHLVQRRRALLAVARDPRARADVRRQVADDHAHRQHHDEGHEVLRVRDGEREARRHEEEVEGHHGEHRREHGGAPPEADGDDHHGEQVDHDLVGQLEERVHRHRDGGGDADREQGPRIARPPELAAIAYAEMLAAAGEQRSRGRRGLFDLLADHHDLEVARRGDDAIRGREAQRTAPARPLLAPDHHARGVARPRVGDQLGGRIAPAERDRRGAELVREPQVAQDAVALGLRQPLQVRRLDVDGHPVGLHPRRHPRADPHQALGVRAGPDAHHEPLGDGPRHLDRVVVTVLAHLPVDALGGAPQRELAQGDQVPLAEEIPQGAGGGLGHVDLALVQPLDQLVGRQVDELDLVGLVEDPVRNRLPDADAGDLADDVVQAFQVLDVHRRVDVDAGVEQLVDVLPPLCVARARDVGVRELVDDDERGLARERGVEVELLQLDAAIGEAPARQDFEPFDERGGLLATVRLDQADHHVDAFGLLLARRRQHRVGLAHAGAGAEEDPEAAAHRGRLLAFHSREQLVGIGAGVFHLGPAAARTPAAAQISSCTGRQQGARPLRGAQRLRRRGACAAAAVRTRSAATVATTHVCSWRDTSGEPSVQFPERAERAVSSVGRWRILLRRSDSQSGEQVSWRP